MENMKKFIKENKVWAIVAVVGLVLALLITIVVGNVSEKTTSENLVNEIVADVNALYEDETKIVLAEGTTMDMVVAIEEKVADVQEMSMTEEVAETLELAITDLEYAKQMVELRDMALELLDDNGVLVDGADIQAVQDKADALAPIKPEWVGLVQMQIDEATKQQNEIATATKNVNALFTDETRTTVRTDVTRSEYETAQASVDVIKNKTSKDSLQQSLNSVDTFLTEQEEKVEQAEVENTSNSSNSSSSSSNSSGNNDNNKNDGPQPGDSWELTVDYYYVNGAMAQGGEDITDEVNDIHFETEEEMINYMNTNYPGCGYTYVIVYEQF